MTVYTCSPDLASILTCIYEAWNSRLGYRNVRLMTEPVGNLESLLRMTSKCSTIGGCTSGKPNAGICWTPA